LEELYGLPNGDEQHVNTTGSTRQRDISIRCRTYGFTDVASGLLEEQERELAHEKEDERQRETIHGAQALVHRIDPALRIFVLNGIQSLGLLTLRQCLELTSNLSSLSSVSFLKSRRLLATRDFRDTVVVARNYQGAMDNFLRGVRWLLSTSKDPDLIILISPFEANELLPEIRRSPYLHLHLYSPRVSRATPSFEDLGFFRFPTSPFTPPSREVIHELNLFAGQLFLADKESYNAVRSMLGLHLREVPEEFKKDVEADGFVRGQRARQALAIDHCAFDRSPVAFLKQLTGWRRKGQGYALSHLGQILHGNPLDENLEFDA